MQAHPSRRLVCERRLLPELPDAVIVYDPEPGAEVASAWRTYRACLAVAGSPGATHTLIVQDDASPCAGLAIVARRIAACRPQRVVSLFHGGHPAGGAVNAVRAYELGLRYSDGDTNAWFPLVAVIWPRHLAAACLAETRDGSVAERAADDAQVGEWMRRRGVRPLVALPNPVEHPDDVPSLVGCKTGQPWRRSVAPVPAGLDPLLLSWR